MTWPVSAVTETMRRRFMAGLLSPLESTRLFISRPVKVIAGVVSFVAPSWPERWIDASHRAGAVWSCGFGNSCVNAYESTSS